MRLGLIVPSTNSVAEADFQRRAQASGKVTVHSGRMFIDATTAAAERTMLAEYLPATARDVATVRPDVVVFSCTSAAAVIGKDGEAQLIDDLRRTTGAAVVSTNDAVHRALRDVGARTVAVVTAYIDELTERIKVGIEGAGMDVSVASGMGIVDPFEIAEVEPEAIVRFAEQELEGLEFDTIFVSCTNLRGMEARPMLSEQFGVPVVTSNQAASDLAFSALGLGAE